MFEKLLKLGVDENADVVSCGYQRTDNDGIARATVPFPVARPNDIDTLARAHSNRMLWFAWRNLYRRSHLVATETDFDPALRTGEDMPFNLAAFGSAARAAVSNEALYFYRENPAGLTMSRHIPQLGDYLQRAYDAKLTTAARLDLPSTFYADMQLYVVENLLGRLLTNELRAPEAVPREAVGQVLGLPMVAESIGKVSLTTPRSRGHRRLLALAKSRQHRLLARIFG